jgi:hypothetical protein
VLGWFQTTITDQGRLPLFLCLLAFVVTFVVTRIITRAIRAGRGPFKNNVSSSGLHVHHAVPGIILLVIGAFVAVGSGVERGWPELAGVLVGIGTALVLDEFALILRLSDVYWSEEGRVSVEMVSLATASLGMGLLGRNAFSINDSADAAALMLSLAVCALHLVLVVVAVSKGKYSTAVFTAFFPIVGWISSIRLARPNSSWARKYYGPHKMQRAQRRADRFEALFGDKFQRLGDLIAGQPEADPAAGAPDPAIAADADPSVAAPRS